MNYHLAQIIDRVLNADYWILIDVLLWEKGIPREEWIVPISSQANFYDDMLVPYQQLHLKLLWESITKKLTFGVFGVVYILCCFRRIPVSNVFIF